MAVYLSLGSNVGDRRKNLRTALEVISGFDDTTLTRVSDCYETEPWGRKDQDSFLNVVAEIETARTPLELLNAAKAVEGAMGRSPGEHWGPRVIDVDIVLWDAKTVDIPQLTVPHPEFRNRRFVLEPLKELAPDAVDPVTGETIATLAGRSEATGQVRRIGPLKD